MMVIYLLIATNIVYLSGITFFDISNHQLIRDLSFPAILGLAIYSYLDRKNITVFKILFLVSSGLFLLYSFSNGMYYLPATKIPKLKILIKVIYYASLFVLFSDVYRKKDIVTTFLKVIFLGTNIFLAWYYLGLTLRSLPVLVYSIPFFVYFISSRRINIPLDFLSVAAILFAISATISTLLSADKWIAFLGMCHFLTGLLLFFIGRGIKKEEDLKEVIFLMIGFFGICCIAFSGFIVYYIILGSGNLLESNIASFHVNGIGGMIALFFPLLFYGLRHKNTTFKVFLYLSFIAVVFVLIKSESRAAMIGVAVSLFLIAGYYIFSGCRSHRRHVILVVLGAIPILILTIIFFQNFIKTDEFLSSRTLMIRFSVWELFLSRVVHFAPYFGFGPDNVAMNAVLPANLLRKETINDYLFFIHNSGINLHGHNILIQYLFSYGSIGLALFLVFMMRSVLHFKKMYFASSEKFGMLIFIFALISIFCQEMLDFTFVDTFTFFPCLFFLGAINGYRDQPADILEIKSFSSIYFRLFVHVFIVIFYMVSFYESYNVCVLLNQHKVAGNYINADIFENLLFKTVPDSVTMGRLISLENRKLPEFIYPRNLQFGGEIYWTLPDKSTKNLENARLKFEACVRLYSYSAFCHRRLYDIYSSLAQPDLAKSHLESSKRLDVFHLMPE